MESIGVTSHLVGSPLLRTMAETTKKCIERTSAIANTSSGPTKEHFYCFSIGNHMISSAIWDKSARVNFSKTNKIARARRAGAICSL